MKKIGLIFDLDQTLVDSQKAEQYRKTSQWGIAYKQIPRFTLYEGISEALKYLSENSIQYCIVTSSPSKYCTMVCDFWNISKENMVCYHDTPSGQKKPHPAPILLALKKMGIEPQHALSFGDRDIDIVSSNNAGVKSVACLWGSENNVALVEAQPSFIISKPIEVITITKAFFEDKF